MEDKDFENSPMNNSDSIPMFENEETEIQSEEENIPKIPCMADEDWDEYVFGHFSENEIFNNNPTVHGLRRIVEKLIGEIVEMRTHIIHAPTMNDRSASATVDIVIMDKNTAKCFSGAADATDYNLVAPYNKYLTAMAETRAEGRALRKALRIKAIAAEELEEVPPQQMTQTQDNDKEFITQNQINFMNLMCQRLNINIVQFIKSRYSECSNIRQLLHTQSLETQKVLSEYQQDKDKIPPEIVGYFSNWQTSF
jgi:hypothetical protein